ncbi:hypothetical protein P7K49_006228, partial [Saguinus oedipus]
VNKAADCDPDCRDIPVDLISAATPGKKVGVNLGKSRVELREEEEEKGMQHCQVIPGVPGREWTLRPTCTTPSVTTIPAGSPASQPEVWDASQSPASSRLSLHPALSNGHSGDQLSDDVKSRRR